MRLRLLLLSDESLWKCVFLIYGVFILNQSPKIYIYNSTCCILLFWCTRTTHNPCFYVITYA